MSNTTHDRKCKAFGVDPKDTFAMPFCDYLPGCKPEQPTLDEIKARQDKRRKGMKFFKRPTMDGGEMETLPSWEHKEVMADLDTLLQMLEAEQTNSERIQSSHIDCTKRCANALAELEQAQQALRKAPAPGADYPARNAWYFDVAQ